MARLGGLVKVLVNARNVSVRKTTGRWRSQVGLRGLPKGRSVVAIEVKTKDGRTLKGQRAYLTSPRRRSRNFTVQTV